MTLPFGLVLAAWWGFALVFVLLRPRGSDSSVARDRSSLLGLALQAAAYALVWSQHRAQPGTGLETVLAWLGVPLAWACVLLALSAVRTLGRNWALEARLVEDHRLVTGGPYRLVRHPIYSAMLGLLLATGLNVSTWTALALGTLLFLAGTTLRTRAEEALLRARFGRAHEDWARRVPALVPWRLGR